MSLALAPIVELYRWGLQPAVPFSWFGIPISTIEVAAAVRLCLILRQARELIARAYKAQAAQATVGASEKEKTAAAALGPKFEEKSLVRDLVATLIVVHGGDAIGVFNIKDAHILRVRVKLMRPPFSTFARRTTVFFGFGRESHHVCTNPDGDRVDSFGPGLVSPVRTSSVVPGCTEQDFVARPRHSWDGFE